jgi:hypothetical protein
VRMAPGPDLPDEAVEADVFELADPIWPCLDLPKVLEINIGVSYFTRENFLKHSLSFLSLK